MSEDLQRYEKIWEECCREESLRCSTEYWNSRAEDYADFITNSDYDHGRKILDLFLHEGIVSPGSHVLDIGSGPGAISIPFAEKVQAVTSIEPADEMIKYLLNNARDKNLSNLFTISQTWQDVNTSELKQMFDLTICCHSIWHFPDLFTQVERMQQVSRNYCALAHGVASSRGDDDISQKLGIPFDEIDRFILVKNILENRGIFPNVSILPITMRRTVESGRAMLTLGLKKYREPDSADCVLIEEHLAANSRDGMYEKTGHMGVLWWRVS